MITLPLLPLWPTEFAAPVVILALAAVLYSAAHTLSSTRELVTNVLCALVAVFGGLTDVASMYAGTHNVGLVAALLFGQLWLAAVYVAVGLAIWLVVLEPLQRHANARSLTAASGPHRTRV